MTDLSGINIEEPVEELAELQQDYYKLINLSIDLLEAVDSDDEESLEEAADALYAFVYGEDEEL